MADPFEARAREALRHPKTFCQCFAEGGQLDRARCTDGLCQDAVERITAALRAVQREALEEALQAARSFGYGDDATHELPPFERSCEAALWVAQSIERSIRALIAEPEKDDGR